MKAIHLKGNRQTITDSIIMFADSFLIVAQDENDVSPTWYNIDQISKLEGVEELPKPPASASRVTWI